jgi:rhamnosyltransferase
MLPETEKRRLSVCLIIPTINPMPEWRRLLDALDEQTLKPDRVVMVDSSSTDGARELAAERGWLVEVVPKRSFDHGGTRRHAVAEFASDCDLVVFLTQDAILAESASIENIVAGFADARVGAVYGRQLPRPAAGPIEEHARYFNYPPDAARKCLDDVPRLGIKTAFFSNSWGAYRVSALDEVGGIPESAICGEDAYVAAKMLLAGYHIVYAAGALAWHSHAFTLIQELKRYFDIGVFHANEPWLLETFGAAGGEGRRFVVSEMRHLARKAPWLIPVALLRSAVKITAYALGRRHRKLPLRLVHALSAHPGFWGIARRV